MNIKSKFLMPKSISDGRVDNFLEIIRSISAGENVELSFEKTKEITPAGHALLFILIDVASEHKVALKITNVSKSLELHDLIIKIGESGEALKGFFEITKLNLQRSSLLVYGKSSSIAPEFIEMLSNKFQNKLGEDRLWEITLTFNELMQNAVDHSTSERYFLYAGTSNSHFEFGILDMGVSIPAKLEVKYQCKDDCEYLKKVFEKGVGTRRDRPGGLGLYYLHENIKNLKGRLVIISREAQVRYNFGSRNYRASKLKEKLFGTWCMANIPLEQK